MLTKAGDFVELEFTGRSNGVVFDSNKPADLKKLNDKAEHKKTIVIIGQGMIVKGLDKALEGKETGKEYSAHLSVSDGFGQRRTELVKTIPLKVFTEQKIYPEQGMSLLLDRMLVTIRAVSGARVIADFNNPLAGKELDYDFTIVRIVEDLSEKAQAFFQWFLRAVPDFEANDKVTVKAQKELAPLIDLFKPKFKELVGRELAFESAEKKKEKKEPEAIQ